MPSRRWRVPKLVFMQKTVSEVQGVPGVLRGGQSADIGCRFVQTGASRLGPCECDAGVALANECCVDHFCQQTTRSVRRSFCSPTPSGQPAGSPQMASSTSAFALPPQPSAGTQKGRPVSAAPRRRLAALLHRRASSTPNPSHTRSQKPVRRLCLRRSRSRRGFQRPA